MVSISIDLDEEEVKLLEKRAKKNILSLKEQVEDIIRRSCVNAKKNKSTPDDKFDDKLIGIFSRRAKGRPRKKW
jgi:hypothetical protein